MTPPTEVYVRAAHRRNPLQLPVGDEIEKHRIAMETAFARPDAEGRYRIDGLVVPGTYVVCAGPCESALVELSAERPRATVDLRSTRGPRRSMRILDEAGKPLANEWISLVGRTGLRSVETSEEGAIDWPPGDWRVGVHGFVGVPAAPTVKLDRGITLKGIVVDAAGKPAPDVWVGVSQLLPGTGVELQGATTDDGGRFACSGLCEGDAWLETEADPETAEEGRLRIRAGMDEVRVALRPRAPEKAGRATATLAGTVEDEAGRPVECARVHVAAGGTYDPVYTDEKGGFSVAVQPTAPVLLKVEAHGLASRYVAVAKAGTPVRIVLEPGGLLRGRVVRADGGSVPGAYVVLWRGMGEGRLSPLENWQPDVDSAGRFELRLLPGTYHARFFARVPVAEVTVRAGETTHLEIRLP